MPAFTIDELVVPVSIDGPASADFISAIDVGNAVDAIAYGSTELAFEPAEELPRFHDQHEPTRMLVARVDGRIVARALYQNQTGDDADSAWLGTQVLPPFRGSGIGSALAEAVEGLARVEW